MSSYSDFLESRAAEIAAAKEKVRSCAVAGEADTYVALFESVARALATMAEEEPWAFENAGRLLATCHPRVTSANAGRAYGFRFSHLVSLIESRRWFPGFNRLWMVLNDLAKNRPELMAAMGEAFVTMHPNGERYLAEALPNAA